MQMQLLSSLVVVGLLATPSIANNGEEWTELDRELEALAAATAQSPTGFDVSGLFRVFYGLNDNTSIPGFRGQDLGGFFLDRTKVNFDGSVGDYGARIQFEAAGGITELLDAYGSWQINDMWRLSVGNFRTPFLWEGNFEEGELAFLQRTAAGEFWSNRNPASLADSKVGAKAEGNYDRFHWSIAAQNGVDGAGDELAISGRAGVIAMGETSIKRQGAYGHDEDRHLTAAVSYFDDGAVNDGDSVGFDIQYTQGRFAADAQFVDFGRDTTVYATLADASSYAIALSFMLVPDEWELALRYQDTDNLSQDEDITLGVNRYMGPNVKWLFNYVDISSDLDPLKDSEERILIGLSMQI